MQVVGLDRVRVKLLLLFICYSYYRFVMIYHKVYLRLWNFEIIFFVSTPRLVLKFDLCSLYPLYYEKCSLYYLVVGLFSEYTAMHQVARYSTTIQMLPCSDQVVSYPFMSVHNVLRSLHTSFYFRSLVDLSLLASSSFLMLLPLPCHMDLCFA